MPSEVYFLLDGDIRVMTATKHTLLNILTGTIFGEQEAIEQVPRYTYAYCAADSMIVICPSKIFFSKLKESESLKYELD